MAGKRLLTVCGWTGCKFYQKAKGVATALSALYPADYEARLDEAPDRLDRRQLVMGEEIFSGQGREDAAYNLQRLRAATTSKGRMTHAFRAFEGLLAA